jgi:hypothetical protein
MNDSSMSSPAGSSLNARQELVARQLRSLDPALEGLYLQGLELSRRFSDPGTPYLLAHAGRELSRGVIFRLSDGKVDFTEVSEAGRILVTEKNRARIAAVLEMSPHDAVVTDWFGAVDAFASNCHYQLDAVAPLDVAAAFDRLDRLVSAILVPYFEATPEVDRLIQVESPTSEDIKALKGILARRALRARFFERVAQPAWAKVLDEWGAFDEPSWQATTFIFRSRR